MKNESNNSKGISITVDVKELLKELTDPLVQQVDTLVQQVDTLTDEIRDLPSPGGLDPMPELLSGSEVKKALHIGPKKFDRLLLKGLDEVAGDGYPRYRKKQIVKLLAECKSLFS